jgi:hypothetical protein
MKVLLLLPALLCGCTLLSVEQRDETPNGRSITTKVSGSAWFSSAQHITKLKALQTEKTQSFGTDTIGQQGATNGVEALKAIGHILEMLRPVP